MRLLLALDGSDSAIAAVDFLLCLPFPAESEVRLLSVVDDYLFRDLHDGHLSTEARGAVEETWESVREEGEELLAVQAARLREAGWRCSTEVRSGYPAEAIAAVAAGHAIDLIVLGSHGLSGVQRFLLGSVSARVLEYAGCSVLIVRRPPHGQLDCRRVLLAYDGSPSAQRAADLCQSLPFKPGTGARLLTVMPLVTHYRQDIRQRLNTIWQDKKAAKQAALDALAAAPRWSGVEVGTAVREGASVSKEILDAALEQRSDLVVLGDKGKGTIERMLLGSATSRVAHHAHCSVLTVRG